MLTEICQYLRNWFELSKLFGEFVISEGNIAFYDGSVLPLQNGQYFRIVGSVFNDGVHKYGDADLGDEEFYGGVWTMAVPPVVVDLAKEIEDWTGLNAEAINSPYQSESFGGYSYTKAGGNSASGTGEISWQSQFAARLSPWRKI